MSDPQMQGSGEEPLDIDGNGEVLGYTMRGWNHLSKNPSGLQIHSLAEVNPTQPKQLPRALPGTSNTPVDKVLEQRGTVYGDFRHNAQVSQELDMVLQDAYRKRSANGLPQLALHQREALRVICQKISRIATGNPDYEDNWVDIAGYAELGRKPR